METTRPRRAFEWVQDQAALLVPGALVALALALPSWRNRLLWHVGSEDIYYELRDGFLYMFDLPLLIALGAWLLTPFWRRIGLLPRWLVAVLVMLPALATASILWAPLPSFAAYQSVRLWLLLGIFLVIATTPEARGALAWGLAISGALQSALGTAQFLAQRTFGLKDFGEVIMRPEWPGASVVTAEGVRQLRAYGLSQHPNLLGGFLMVAALVGAGLAAGSRGWRCAAAIALTGASFACLLLTFSRAAWAGLAVGAVAAVALLLYHRLRVNWRAVGVLVVVLAVIGALFLATQWPFVMPRLGLAEEGVEIRSADERLVLESAAWTLITEHPVLGVGYGNFALALWQRRPEILELYPIYQPVHRVPLLATAELGVPGLLIWLVLAAGPWVAMLLVRRRARPPGTAAAWPFTVPAGLALAGAAALAALTAVSWFDFYPWFSPQGRLLSWTMLGLWSQTMVVDWQRAVPSPRSAPEEMG